MSQPLLWVQDLSVSYETPEGPARAVDGVSFAVAQGEAVAIVGESGSGKSTLALALLGLLPAPPASIDPASRILYDGVDLASGSNEAWRRVRGRQVGMVFQDPALSLNPVLTVGAQIAEVVRTHSPCSKSAAWARSEELLSLVGMDRPTLRARQYPHQLSGGLRQRALIATALGGNPRLLLADEPTAALDATVQMQIVELLADLRQRLDMALLVITHDFGLVPQIAERVLVMYAGQIAESAPSRTVFVQGRHPYTQGLLRAAHDMGGAAHRLAAIPGSPPPATAWPVACRFHPRCPHAWERCRTEAPELEPAGDSHAVRCWMVHERPGMPT